MPAVDVHTAASAFTASSTTLTRPPAYLTCSTRNPTREMPSSTKRPGDGDASDDGSHHHHPAKVARTDAHTTRTGNGTGPGPSPANGIGDDAATHSKKKMSGSTRTGQACDRCKIRKIRCDARPGGCSPCLQNNTECKTTDRITGRATARGHAEHIENENAQLKMYMVELQQQLRDQGVEPKPPPPLPSYMASSGTPPYWGQAQSSWTDVYQAHNLLAASSHARTERAGSVGALLPDFRPGCIGDNYLGVSSESSWLSPIEGTSLALFGTKVDLAEFMPGDSDPATSGMSYRTFLNHAFGRVQPYRPDLPAYEQCKVYAEWYFRSIQQFIPILHKPDFMELLDRIHHHDYHPKSSEAVMVHMVLAIINFQFAARNGNEQAREDSMNHYHYACSFIPDLITGHTLEDIQALTLICSQLRNQPRPGAAWMFTNMVMGLAIESGLHRSAKAWQTARTDKDAHHLEMRKRTFWSLLLLHVHISGKLGRPMPLRMEDFDIEMPEAEPDKLPGETADKWKKCSFRAGIEGFKLLRIIMQTYSTIYSIKSTGQYELSVRQMEKELEAFQSQIPSDFQAGAQMRDEDRISALYLEMSVAEVQLMLHHPALCRSSSSQTMTSNLDTCLHWSNKLLQTAVQVKNLKSLDTTWYYVTDFLAAIFTTLFAYTGRRDQMNSQDLQRLRQDMDLWVEVMTEVANLLGKCDFDVRSAHTLTSVAGATPQLIAAIRGIIEFSLGNIQRHIAAKTASAAVASTSSPPEQTQPHEQQIYANGNGYSAEYTNGHANGGDVNGNHVQGYSQADQAQNTYPSAGHYTYPPAQANGMYNAQANMTGYDHSAYPTDDAKPNIEAELVAHVSMAQQQPQQPAPSNFMAAFSPNPQVTNGFQQASPTATMNGQAFPQSGPAAWRHFADSMMTNSSGQEFIHSAGALMALSGGKQNETMEMAAASMGNIQMPHADVSNQPWPLMTYSNGGEHQQ